MNLQENECETLIYTATKFWVYLLCDDDLEVIYVGATTDIETRLKCHRRQLPHCAVALVQCNNHSEMIMVELNLIEKYTPIHNKAGVLCPYNPPKERR